MRRIIVSQAAQGLVAAPGHLRSSHEAMEKAEIQTVKNLVQIVVLALGTFNAFASAKLAYKLRFLRHDVAAGVFAVTRGMGRVHGLAMQLGDEDMRDGVKHRFRRAFKKI